MKTPVLPSSHVISDKPQTLLLADLITVTNLLGQQRSSIVCCFCSLFLISNWFLIFPATAEEETKTLSSSRENNETNKDALPDAIAAQATPASGSGGLLAEIDSCTSQILQKELELSRLNTLFRMETSLVSPWRQRRMFLYSQANSWLTQASLISQMKVRYKLAKERRPKGSNNVQFDTEEELPDDLEFQEEEASERLPETEPGFQTAGTDPTNDAPATTSGGIPRNGMARQRGKDRGKLAGAAEIQLTGQLIGAGGAAFEMGLNLQNYLKLRKKGLTPALYHKQVHTIHEAIDKLIEERKELCANNKAALVPYQQIIEKESKLIHDLRDLALFEYAEYHAAAKRFWVLQNTAYFVDITKNMLGATGNIIGLTGNHRRRPRMQGGAGIFSILSGVVVLLTPAVGRVSGNLSGLAARRLTSKELAEVGVKDLSIFSADRLSLLQLYNNKNNLLPGTPALSGLPQRLAIYENTEKLLKDNIAYREKQRQRARETLIENIIFAGIVGPPRITNGITQVLGGWHYYTDPPKANKLYAAGATAYAAGTAFNSLETARVQAEFEWRNLKQRKTHSTPKDQFKSRLQRLDQMATQLKK